MIIQYKDLAGSKTIGPVDVCIIGSGAGGGVMAYYLAKAGFSVVVLEKGGYFPPAELGRKEVYMLTRIEAPTIFTPATGKYTRISMLAGECYGGGTVASDSVTWDFPRVILEDWAKMGLDTFSPETNPKLEEYRLELRKLLSVKPVPIEHLNPSNQLMMIAAEREGLEWKNVERPVEFCFRCGCCAQGCHYGVKKDAANTFLSWSHKYRTEIYCGAEAKNIKINYPTADDYPYCEKLKNAQGKAREDVLRELENQKGSAPAKFTITAEISDRKAPLRRDKDKDKKSLIVHARQVVLSAGPIGNTRVLLRSKINPGNLVGKRFTLHPTSFHFARFPKNIEVRAWDGISDAIEVTHYAYFNKDKPYYDPEKHAFYLENAFSLPWGFASILPGYGKNLVDLMNDQNHFAGMQVNVKTDSYGEITEDEVRFDISERDNQAMIFGTYLVARLFFRAGAKEVYIGLPNLLLKSPNQLDEILNYRYGKARLKQGFMIKQANLHTGHIFGGVAMGKSRLESFADQTGECHQIKGLWVADGSAFPTNVGVNPCLSIMFVARKTADHFIAKAREP